MTFICFNIHHKYLMQIYLKKKLRILLINTELYIKKTKQVYISMC